MRPPCRLLPALAVLLLASPADAQRRVLRARPPDAPGAAASTLDAAARAALVEAAATALDAQYVFPEVGARLAAHLQARLRTGAYDGFSDGDAFADALTRELRAEGHDLHLGVLSPSGARGRMLAPPQPGGGDEPGEWERDRNHFFRALEVLPGNVGYLALDRFPGAPDARATADAALAFLGRTDAVILDLRRNPGGAEGLNQYLSSYFFSGEDPTLLYTRYYRDGDSTGVVRVLPRLPGPRLPDVPLYVLTARQTGSAAENMAYALQTLGRATVVGDTTAGAANSARPVPLPHGFVLTVPSARVVSPVTGTNWEGVGVAPDVAVPADRALDAAHALALRARIARTEDPAARAPLERALEVADARQHPVALAPDALARYAGRYGERTVAVEDGALYYRRGDGPRLRLAPLTAELFAFDGDPDARVSFTLDRGVATGLRVLLPDGRWIDAVRTGD